MDRGRAPNDIGLLIILFMYSYISLRDAPAGHQVSTKRLGLSYYIIIITTGDPFTNTE